MPESRLDKEVNMRIETNPLWKTMEFSVYNDTKEIREEWLTLGELANDPYSCFAWCESWYRASRQHNTGKALIVVGRSKDGKAQMLIPLFVEKKAGMRLITRPARRVSGDFGAIFTPELKQSITPENAGEFWARMAKVIPGDIMIINGVSSDEIDRQSPFGYLYQHKSRIDGFHTTLSEDWDKQYEEMFSSKIRRNDRRCGRRMEEEGKVDYEVIASPEKQGRALTALIAQKVEQLEKAGQPHHYHDPTVSAFYKNLPALMHDSLDEEFLFVALKFNDEVIATNFGVRKGKRHYGMMTSMTAQMRKYSPGRLVMLETAKTLCGRGCSFYDFGNGEYQYKQYWCSGKRSRYTVLLPLSLKGRLVFPVLKMALRHKDSLEDKKAAQEEAEKGTRSVKKEG